MTNFIIWLDDSLTNLKSMSLFGYYITSAMIGLIIWLLIGVIYASW
jgi:hypothetical protein